MKERPILFSTPMVQAILEGRKTQTRRIIKPQPIEKSCTELVAKMSGHENALLYDDCKYGIPGDHLWVRETHYRYGHWKKNGMTKTGKQKWSFIPDPHFSEVRYVDNPPMKIEKNTFRGIGWYKRSSLFMPRTASRINLKITNIRVERLNDITEEDAQKEGIEKITCKQHPENISYRDVNCRVIAYDTAIDAFHQLWESINGIGSWNQNPWVWVIEFKRIKNT